METRALGRQRAMKRTHKVSAPFFNMGTGGSGRRKYYNGEIPRLDELQAMLRFSHDAAKSFYREPGRGFRVVRKQLLRHLMLKTYADGVPFAKLLAGLRAAAKQIA